MYNKVILIGRISTDLHLKQGNNGNGYLSFNLAINRVTRQQIGDNNTIFVPCVAFRQTADYMNKYLNKGALVSIEGSISISSYQDKNGNSATSFDIIVNNIIPLESRARREEILQQKGNYSFENNYKSNDILVQTPEQYKEFNKDIDSFVDNINENNDKSTSSMFDDVDWE
ncbi:single-stranded DNA-binding protein [Mycoplasmopsis cricetuli]|uniref:single-stranded DNA-binding protein n=1 Tax=Mycoplasmopsis cricetuli TaxID=171283 RepID=UPI0004703430|nr:single-stranded DNA-binding protein [Mycoplasmopsis cricetuli]